VDESALTIYIASCERLEELGCSVEERPAELEIMQLEDDPPYDGDVMVSPAVFLNLGAVPLNELTVVMDVRPVREQKVCCALVQHAKPKEGSHWGGPVFAAGWPLDNPGGPRNQLKKSQHAGSSA
jgi:hypothetical protein